MQSIQQMLNHADGRYPQPNRQVKRKRVSIACATCRAHKIRCDGIRPRCGTCVRRRESCVYEDDNIQHGSIISQSNANTGCREDNNSGLQTSLSSNLTEQGESGVTAMGLVSRPLSSDQEPKGGFFGDSSTVAFIKQLQDTFKSRTPGPDSLHGSTDLSRQSMNRERSRGAIEAVQSKIPRNLLPPRPLADHLVDCYFSKIHTLCPFVHREAFLTTYQSLWRTTDSPSTVRSTHGLGLRDIQESQASFYYGLNVIFALGCQFSDTVQVGRETTSEAFFHRSKPALDVDYLEGGDLALTQTLLLMAHYLQSSLTPNRCWHVIGTACRLAQGVGLHSDVGNEHRSFAEIQIRRRVWHGCVTLDLTISIILGRPAMMSHATSTPLPDAIDDTYLTVDSPTCTQPPGMFSRVEWFIATLKLYRLLRKTQNTLYSNTDDGHTRNPVDKKQAEQLFQIQCITQLDAELQGFRLNTPVLLRWDAPAVEDRQGQFLRERYLLQARFLYLKLLIYRPILSQSLRETLSSVAAEGQTHHPGTSETGIYDNFTMNCSVLCVQSAIDLISLVHETCSTDLASVWFYNVFYVFTAGSITLLAEFHPPIVNVLTREALKLAWGKCQASLEYLKSYSVVAERCASSMHAIRSKCLMALSDQVESDESAADQQVGTAASTAHIPFSEDLLSDFDFDAQTLFDPFWFNLEF